MSSVRSAILSGIIAAIVATGLIVAVTLIPGTGLFSFRTSESTQTGQGTLEILFTDPPTVPENVSAVYIQYSEVQSHIANVGNETGWYTLGGSGEINLMSLVNVSQTIAASNVPAGKFNGLRFNVTSIFVSYSPNFDVVQSHNYTGVLANSRGTLYVWIADGITVSAAQTSAALVDLAPTVVLTGSISSPTFVFVPSMVAYVIPSSAIPAESHSIGVRESLVASSWWTGLEAGTHFAITSVSLMPDSLNITVENQGNSFAELKLAGVTMHATPLAGMESTLKTSDIFVVESSGALLNLNTTNKESAEAQLAGSGFVLAPGQSVTLTYSGPILIGVQIQMISPKFHAPPINPTDFYICWVQGNGQTAERGTLAG